MHASCGRIIGEHGELGTGQAARSREIINNREFVEAGIGPRLGGNQVNRDSLGLIQRAGSDALNTFVKEWFRLINR